MVSDFYLDYVGGAQTSMLEQRAAPGGCRPRGAPACARCGAKRPDAEPRVHEVADGMELRPAFTVAGVVLPVTGATTGAHHPRSREYFVRERGGCRAPADRVRHRARRRPRRRKRSAIPVVSTIHTFYWQSSGPWCHAGPADHLARRLQNVDRGAVPEGPLDEPAERQPAAQPHPRARATAWIWSCPRRPRIRPTTFGRRG